MEISELISLETERSRDFDSSSQTFTCKIQHSYRLCILYLQHVDKNRQYYNYVSRCSTTGWVFIKYCVFSLKFDDFSELCQFCCSAGVLPAWCVYTHQHRGKTGKGQSLEYFKIFEKTQNF